MTVATPTLAPTNQCIRKVPYVAFETALWKCHAIAAKEQSEGTPRNFTVYQRPHCGKYHVGRVP